MIAELPGGDFGGRESIGQAIFLSATLLWAAYTVALRKARLGGLHATAIACMASLIVYIPIYLALFGPRVPGMRREGASSSGKVSIRPADRGRVARPVRPRGGAAGRLGRRRLHRARPGHRHAARHTDPGRMAERRGLDRDRRHQRRRLSRQRRPLHRACYTGLPSRPIPVDFQGVGIAL